MGGGESGKLTQRKFSFLLRGGGGRKPDNRHRSVGLVLGGTRDLCPTFCEALYHFGKMRTSLGDKRVGTAVGG